MRKTSMIFSLVMTIALIFSMLTTTALAMQDDSKILQDEAGTIAIMFIADSIKGGTTNWNKYTRIKEIVPLYGDDDAVTAYSFELSNIWQDNGYVIVSASDDMNVIQEFSDTAIPVYRNMIKNENNRVYHTSALEYYVKDNTVLSDTKGHKIELCQLKNKFKKDKNISDGNKLLRKLIKGKGTLKLDEWKLGYKGQVPNGDNISGIYDAYTYVNDRYGSGWVSAYYGSLESKINKHLLTETDYIYPNNNGNNCSLTALATIFEYWKNYGGASSLPSGYTNIYKDIHSIAENNGWWTSSGGTDFDRLDDIATEMWKKNNYSEGRGNNDYYLEWSVATSEIDQGRPFVFNISPLNNYYSNHSITVYAYCAYKRNSDENEVKFLKVADGWTKDARYIDWTQFTGFGSWTKVFKN